MTVSEFQVACGPSLSSASGIAGRRPDGHLDGSNVGTPRFVGIMKCNVHFKTGETFA
jgi:hypothetical protein